MSPRTPDTPASSVRSTASVSPGLPALPPIPPGFFFQEELQMASAQKLDSITLPPEDQPDIKSKATETVSEEHPYACIENMRNSEPSSPTPGDEADEDRWDSESPYHTVPECTKPTASSDITSFLPVTDSEQTEESDSPAVQDVQPLIYTHRTAIYAAVNRKNKSQRSFKAPVEQNTALLGEDEAPPVPEKIFD